MDLILHILLFGVSIFTLVKASDWFVGASETIGLSLGISPFVIGVTLVAFGTSLPELAASLAAVASGTTEIVIGNVVGSNIANILLILGVAAVVGGQIDMDPRKMDNNILMLLASAIFMWFAVMDNKLDRFEAILFVFSLVFFVMTAASDRDIREAQQASASWRDYVLLVVGGGLVYLGAHFTIYSLEQISEELSVPAEVIALTGVAFGTSLPEVVVSVTAVRKGKSDIAVGNVLGSNIFNTFVVMGIPGLITSLNIPDTVLGFSLPLMVAVTVLFCFMFLAPRIRRWEGMILIVFYIFFIYKSFNF